MLPDFTPTESISELKIEDRIAGSGDEVKAGDTVTCHYTGAIAKTGTIFQTSHDFGDAISFPLSGVIAGWTEGVPGMKVGGTRRLYIPAAKAYGANPPYGSGIPSNADLVFDIELVSIGSK
jgi:peptidylprolyl isomerase